MSNTTLVPATPPPSEAHSNAQKAGSPKVVSMSLSFLGCSATAVWGPGGAERFGSLSSWQAGARRSLGCPGRGRRPGASPADTFETFSI